MRVFKSSASIQISQNSSKKKGQGAQPRRLSPAEVQARFEELKMKKHGSEALAKQRAKFKRSQTSQFMGGGILNRKRFPQAEVQQVAKPPEAQPIEQTQAEGPAYDSPNTDDYTIQSDIANNDPNSDVTREKLKGILSAGGFSFNPKERDVLSKILAE